MCGGGGDGQRGNLVVGTTRMCGGGGGGDEGEKRERARRRVEL